MAPTSASLSTLSFQKWSVWDRMCAHLTLPLRWMSSRWYSSFSLLTICTFASGWISPVAAPMAYSLSGRKRTLDNGVGSSSNNHHIPSISADNSPVLLVCSMAPRKTGELQSRMTHPFKQAISVAFVSSKPSPPRTIDAPNPARWDPPPFAWLYEPST